MNIPTRKKGQGAFEYILLLAGILLIVVLVIVILKGGLLTETQSNVQASSGSAQANARSNCLNWCGSGAWKYYNSSATGNTTMCTDALLLGGSTAGGAAYTSCIWTSTTTNVNCTAANGYVAGIPPQNSRACSFFAPA